MLRSATTKAMAVVRGLALFGGAVVGLALIIGLTVGVASVAFGADGKPFLLGKDNLASALTKLTSTHDGSAMQIQSKSTGTNDTALNLNVQPGEAPMRVNSTGKVSNLNSDRLDGSGSSDLVPGGEVPAGTTIRGNYSVGNVAAQAGRSAGTDSISFGYQLPSAPLPAFVPSGAGPTQQCPGTYDSPQAQPGYLCVYEESGSNQSSPPEVGLVNTVGGILALYAKDAGASHSYGTWAVTVPTAAQAAKLPSAKTNGTSATLLARP